MDIEDAQRQLLQAAAKIANTSYSLPGHLAGAGDIFRESNRLSNESTLTLSIEPHALLLVPEDEKELVLIELRRIAVAAMKQAIIQHPELLIGLVLGSARKGEDYFDRFAKGQRTLFPSHKYRDKPDDEQLQLQ